MNVLLTFPSFWCGESNPYLSLPCLSAYLRKQGVSVIQKDLNIGLWEFYGQKDNLLRLYQAVVEKVNLYKKLSKTNKNFLSFLQRDGIHKFSKMSPETFYQFYAEAKRLIHSEAFFDLKVYHSLINVMTNFFTLLEENFPDYPVGQMSAEPPKSTLEIISLVENETKNNPLLPYYEWEVMPLIKEGKVDLVGISITDGSQLVASYTLAKQIKKTAPEMPIVIGGSYATRLAESLAKRKELSQYIDYMILYEGERGLFELVEAINSNKKDLSKVPNLVYRKNGELTQNEILPPEDISTLPTPDFDGLNLDAYISPYRILPLYVSRGCYWGKCNFCNIDYCFGYGKHRTKKIDKIMEDIHVLKEKYNSSLFFFTDEAIAPNKMREISSSIIKDKTNISWACAARFEPQFDKELLTSMAKAGCKMLFFGLESANQRVLDFMNKGTNIETAKRIIKDSHQAGILNNIYLFFGFPTETKEEAQSTIDFISENLPYMTTVRSSVFSLKRHSPVARDPEKFKVKIYLPLDQDLLISHAYKPLEGMTLDEVQESYRQLGILCENYFPPFLKYMLEHHMFLYLCYYTREQWEELLKKGPENETAAQS